jgi:hypothetical protein
MTSSAHRSADGERRIRVIVDRVGCPRVGTVDLHQCRECAYLLRLEDAGTAETSAIHVVCSTTSPDLGQEFAW